MNRLTLTGIVLLGFATSCLSQQQTSTPASDSNNEYPLLKVTEIGGDQSAGFNQKCLLVYPDGAYHREERQQVSKGNRARGDWQDPEAVGGTLSTEDRLELKGILESSDFRGISGNYGFLNSLDILWVGPEVAVPHGQIDVLEVAAMQSDGLQLFAVIGLVPTRDLSVRLEPFKKWVRGVEARRPAGSTAPANNCNILRYAGKSYSRQPITRLYPTQILPPGAEHAKKRGCGACEKVSLRIVVGFDGRSEVTVNRGVNPDLNRTAVQAFEKLRFAPAELNDLPMPSWMIVDVPIPPK
jgi:hypothetical protein